MDYRGYEIKRVMYQGLANYAVPALPGQDMAASVKTAERWIDSHIREKRAFFDRALDMALFMED